MVHLDLALPITVVLLLADSFYTAVSSTSGMDESQEPGSHCALKFTGGTYVLRFSLVVSGAEHPIGS